MTKEKIEHIIKCREIVDNYKKRILKALIKYQTDKILNETNKYSTK